MRIPLLSLIAVSLIGVAYAAPEAFEAGPEARDQLPRGKEADGIVGDFILRNDKIEAVISGNRPLRRANMSTFYGPDGITPGCLYDLTLRGANNDQITIFSPAGQQGAVSWVRVVENGRAGEAVIETVATAPNHNGIARRHEYRLRDGWQGVLVTTIFRNESAAPVSVPPMDKWTVFKRTGRALGITWAEAIDPADRAGYAYAITEAPPGFTPEKVLPLAPGAEVKVTRFLAVGKSAAEAFGIVAARLGPVSVVSGTVKEKQGGAVATAQVAALVPGAKGGLAGIGYTDAQGAFSLHLPAGSYELSFDDQGRESNTRTVALKDGEPQSLAIELGPTAGVELDIRDEQGVSLPCKAQFRALDGAEQPNLGPENRAHGCVDQWHSETGKFRVALAPGRYKVTVTRGIEYSHLAQEITVERGKTAPFRGTLKRLVDTRGWVSADYHNHSTPSGDNSTGTNDRIINLAAEHIEFAPTTEHNRLYDWRPHIEQLGLTKFIQTVPGLELTGGGAHLNSFPFKPEPFTQDNGAPVWNKDPRVSALTLREWQGGDLDRWVQINHPDMVENFIDRDGDGKVDGGFFGLAMLVDGVESQNYRASELLGGRPYSLRKDAQGKESVQYVREFIWLQMLNRGHRYAAMAVCDAHSVYGNGVGGWRMYMPSRTDEPSEIDWRENSRHAKAGRSILTTGPFLTVQTEDGAGPGQTLRANGQVKLHVKVQCTDWIDIDRLQVLVNGRARPELNFTRAAQPELFANGVVKFERTLDIPLSEDAHLIVVAAGEKSDLSIGYGTSFQANIQPFAYHNPIFVDVDGGGFTPNGDTLGWPLPVKKIDAKEAKQLLELHEKAR
jgi:hypothetical protein